MQSMILTMQDQDHFFGKNGTFAGEGKENTKTIQYTRQAVKQIWFRQNEPSFNSE